MLLERDQNVRENLNENNRKYKHLNKCFPVSLKQFLWHNNTPTRMCQIVKGIINTIKWHKTECNKKGEKKEVHVERGNI